MGINSLDLIGIIITPPEEEGVVGPRGLGGTLHLPFPGLQAGRRRLGIGHLHEGGRATSDSGTALTLYRGLVCEPRLAEVHLIIDAAW